MKTSESLNELAAALAKAQCERDFESEGRIVNRIFNLRRRAPMGGYLDTPEKILARFYDKVAFGISECWYWTGSLSNIGYGSFTVLGENVAHRVSWILHNGPIPEGQRVLLKCDVRNCVNPDHLFLGTHDDNMRDMVLKGRWRCNPARGEESSLAKLTDDGVREMRRLRFEAGMSYAKIAKMFHVSRSAATLAINGITWRHV